MYKKTSWVLVTLFIVLSMILAACQPAAEETPTEPPAATDEPAMTEAPAEGEQIGGSVNVLVVWGDAELENFQAMLAPFEERTGVTVEIESTRDLNAVLTSRVEGGNPPDVAGLPGPGQLLTFAESGDLQPLNEALDMDTMTSQYDEGILQLASVNDQLYGIFIKISPKSFVWYNPQAFDAAGYAIPETWEQLNDLEAQIIADGTTPWCIGLESGAASGWPGTDWIEDIMLRTAGPDVYDQWVNHEIEWTSDAVTNAWETWGTVVNDPEMVFGGPQNVLTTNFGESPFPMFEDPPVCYLHRQADFITGFITEQFPDLVAGEDYNFFPFPPIDESQGNPLLIAGDLFGMFNDTPQAQALMQWLVTPEAQAIWAERGGFISANTEVDPSVYPDTLTQQIGQMVPEAAAVRFDASDLMPSAVNSAFWSGILDFVGNPDQLPDILQSIEDTAVDAYGQ
ncbi:MAG TPA: ABC transporter substrate-binding protein [Anaerolineales bacterium]